MLEHIIEGLFHRAKEIVADIRGEAVGRKLWGQFEFQFDRGELEEIFRVAANIMRKTLQCVVSGADRPNDFIHRANHLAGGFGNLIDLLAGFGLLRAVHAWRGH